MCPSARKHHGTRWFIAQALGKPGGRACQPLRLSEIGLGAAKYLIVQFRDEFRVPLRPVIRQKTSALRSLRLGSQLLLETNKAHSGDGGIRQKPFSSKIFFRRFRHRPRMKPMEPAANRNRLATSE